MNEQKKEFFFVIKGIISTKEMVVRKGSKWTSIDYNRENKIKEKKRKAIWGAY